MLLHTEVTRQHLLNAEGDSWFLTRTLTPYGHRRDQLGADLRRPLPAWGIMHRYSNFTWWMRRPAGRRCAVAIYGPTSSGKTALSLDVCEAASEDALPVLVGGTGVYVQSVSDGWDLTGTGTLRRSLERDFPRSDVKGAYQVLARLAPEVARRVHPSNYEAILNALVRRMTGEASNKVATPFAFAVYGVDRGEAETDRRIETTLDAQIRAGLLEEIAELDRRYRLVEQARRPGRRCNVASQTHGYREFVRVAASTGKAIAELDGADLAAARAEALGHIWAYSRRQRSWFRKLDASRVDRRAAVKVIVSRLP